MPTLGVIPWLDGVCDRRRGLAGPLGGLGVARPPGPTLRRTTRSTWRCSASRGCPTSPTSTRWRPSRESRSAGSSTPHQLADPDLVVLPGTKSTVGDLDWLRSRRLDRALAGLLRSPGAPGGARDLRRLPDARAPHRRRRPGWSRPRWSPRGSGCSMSRPPSSPEKRTVRRRGREAATGTAVAGYEIHHGRVTVGRRRRRWFELEGADGDEREGVADEDRGIYATTLHGVLETDDFRAGLLARVAGRRAKAWAPSAVSFAGAPAGPGRPGGRRLRGPPRPRRPCGGSSPKEHRVDPVPHQRRHRAVVPAHAGRGSARRARSAPGGQPAPRRRDPLAATGSIWSLVRLLGGRRSLGAAVRPAREPPARRRRCRCSRSGARRGSTGSWPRRRRSRSRPCSRRFDYLVPGGPSNLEQFLRFVSDRVLGTAYGFEPATVVPECGTFGTRDRRPGRPTVGVIFYRAHLVAGNTRFVDELCDGVEAAGANAVALYCYSLRSRDADEAHPVIELARPGRRRRGGDDGAWPPESMAESLERWDPGTLASLDVPVVQAICATTDARSWADVADRPLPGRRGHVGGHPRVRRPHHLGALLLQGGGRRRRRPRGPGAARTGRCPTGWRGWPGWRSRWPGCGRSRVGRATGGARAVGVPDQAQPARQRGRASTRRPRCSSCWAR